jgi:hypothetical protein
LEHEGGLPEADAAGGGIPVAFIDSLKVVVSPATIDAGCARQVAATYRLFTFT